MNGYTLLKNTYFTLLLGLLFALSSCIRADQLAFNGIESVKINGLSTAQASIDLGINATNASAHNLTVTDLQLNVHAKGEPVLSILLRSPVTLPHHSNGVTTLPVIIRFNGPLGALSAYAHFKQGTADLMVSGYITAKAGWGKKRFNFPDTSLDAICRQFGIDPTVLFNQQ